MTEPRKVVPIDKKTLLAFEGQSTIPYILAPQYLFKEHRYKMPQPRPIPPERRLGHAAYMFGMGCLVQPVTNLLRKRRILYHPWMLPAYGFCFYTGHKITVERFDDWYAAKTRRYEKFPWLFTDTLPGFEKELRE
ncbi:hypothetical protein PROFUN_10997 [Planoprotostelium fungivorum]|uniref:Uncharacterized protein n=1 Tax=Planoprotostelium fungivorum TaxID=1890364 RepID=A0A2P6NBZ0_9EUKA|nr:hypothetical protein PROFUN_10997 [Planoprotostelium fungivorum]